MKSALGYVVWAAIDPASWMNVVQDGGEVHVDVTRTITAKQLSEAEWNESFLPGTTLTFRFKTGFGGGQVILATTLVPKTYEVRNPTLVECDARLNAQDDRMPKRL